MRMSRAGLAVVVALALPVGAVGERGYAALCAGRVDTYPAIAAAEAAAAAGAQGSPAGSVSGLLGSARAGALALVLAVKQSDQVAFPAHVVAGWALERGGC